MFRSLQPIGAREDVYAFSLQASDLLDRLDHVVGDRLRNVVDHCFRVVAQERPGDTGPDRTPGRHLVHLGGQSDPTAGCLGYAQRGCPVVELIETVVVSATEVLLVIATAVASASSHSDVTQRVSAQWKQRQAQPAPRWRSVR